MIKKFIVCIFVILFLFSFSSALAAVTVTTATGGSAISADTTGGSYTSLTGPIITEGVTADIGIGTIILNAPTGFEFNTGNNVTVTRTDVSGTGCNASRRLLINAGSSQTVIPTSSTITISVTRATSSSCRNIITWSGIQIRPTAGTPLASGNITKTGTSTISGITNGSTNLGTLTEVPGALANFYIPSISTQTKGTPFNISITARDQFNNTASSFTGTATLSNLLGGISPTTSSNFISGVLSTQSVTLNNSGTDSITATSAGKSGTSNTFTVNNVAPTVTGVTASNANGIYGFSQIIYVQVNFSQAVTVTGIPQLTLSTGSPATTAINYTSGSGTSTLTFNYTISLGNASTDLDYASTSALALNGGTIKDTASGTVNAILTLATPGATNSLGANKNIVIDTSNPISTINSPSDNSYSTSTTVALSGTSFDTNLSTTTISVDGGGFVPTSGTPDSWTYSATSLSQGAHTFQTKATDSAGNTGLSTIVHVTVDSINPTVDSVLVQTGLRVNVTFSEPMGSGVTTALNYTISGTGKGTLANNPSSVTFVSGNTYSLTWTSGLMISGGDIIITVANAQDTAGNVIGSPNSATHVGGGIGLDHFVFETISTQTAGVPFSIRITAKDASNNTLSNYVGTVDLTSTAGLVNPSESNNFVSGILNQLVSLSGYGEGKIIIATDHGGTKTGTSNSFTVIAPTTKFVILNPTDGTVDNPITITVQARRADDSIDTSYQEDVTLNASGLAAGAGLVSIINGVGTISISDTIAETVNLSLSDSQSTGLDFSSTQDVVFAGGALAQFELNDTTSTSAGSRQEYIVTRKDQYGNLTTSGVSTVYLYSTPYNSSRKFYDAITEGNVITQINIGDGNSTANFWYYNEAPGTYSVTASDNASLPDGNINVNDAVDSIIVTAGPTSQFILDNPGDVYVDTRLGYTVTRKDQFNNLATASSNIVYLYAPSGVFYDAATEGNVITQINIADGNSTANFWYSNSTPGIYTITASDSTPVADGPTGIVDAEDATTISALPIVATKFVILNPTDGTVDNPIAVTVQAQDNSGNIDTTYQSDVTLVASGSATGAGLVDIVNGVGTINISDATAETINLSLSDTQETGLNVGSTQNVNFSVGAVNQFALNNPGDISAGSRIEYIVTRKDRYGNLVNSGLTKVYLYGLPVEPTKKFYDSASGGSVINFINITEGNSTASFWYYDEHATTSTIVVSDNDTYPDGGAGIADAEDDILVSASLVAKFTLDNPGDMNVNTRLGYTVSRFDQFDNPVTSGVTVVYLYSSSTGGNFKFYDSSTGGLVINSVAIDNGNSFANFWYYDETAGTWVITVSDNTPTPNGTIGVVDAADTVMVSTIPIVATKFVISSPASVMVGTPLVVTVEAQDNSGNIDTTYQSDVTLVASGSATGAGLVDIVNGVGTIDISDTTAETVNLSLSDTQTTGLSMGSAKSVIFSLLPVFDFGGAGSGAYPLPVVGKVSFSGKAYPGAKLTMMAVKEGEDQVIEKETVTSSNGNFSIEFTGLTTGARSYALLVQDKENRLAQSKVFDLNLLSSDSILDISNIIVSPTIGFPRSTVTKGDFMAFVGSATPGSQIKISVDDNIISANIFADSSGVYKYLFNTLNLDIGSHTVKVSQDISEFSESEFSPQKVFFVTNLTVPKTDFNNDGKINISDWSIFLARWLSKDEGVRILDDLNGDGKVNATDFSIFIRTLRQ